MLLDDITAVKYVTINKMADQNSGPLCSSRTLSPVGVFTCVLQSNHIFKEIIKLIIRVCTFLTPFSPLVTASTSPVTLALIQEVSHATVTWHVSWLRVVQ